MRGQAGIEGMILFAIIGVSLVFVMTIFSYRTADTESLKVSVEANKICGSLKSVINSVHSNGEGSSLEVDLPEKIFATNYTAEVHSSVKKIFLSWKNNSASCVILTPNVTNTTHRDFVLETGKRTFRNSGGVVVVV